LEKKMLCRLCETEKPLIDAHIIPRSFFLEHADPKQPNRLVTDRANTFPKRSPIGVYDSTILCAECEAFFSPYDDYGYRFFHPKEDYPPVIDQGETLSYLVRDVHYSKLKLFLLAVLWRASVSTHEFYARVRLGPHEQRIRQLLLAKDAGPLDEYSIVIGRFDYSSALVPILCPAITRLGGFEFYELLFNGFLVFVKIDSQPLSGLLREMMLRPDSPLHIQAIPYKGSQEHSIMVKGTKAAYNRP
jgi:hypothetical protein